MKKDDLRFGQSFVSYESGNRFKSALRLEIKKKEKELDKKVISGIMLSVIIASTLIIAFNLPTVIAQEPPIEVWSDYSLERDITFSGDGFIIKADGITLDLNSHTIFGSDVGINLTEVDGVIVKNGEIRDFYYGIYLSYSNSNTITGNTLTNNTLAGIYLDSSGGNTITGNIVTNNQYGIELEFTYYDNTIMGNTLTNNQYSIYLHHAPGNAITQNMVINNVNGIQLVASHDNILVGNNVINSVESGIWLSPCMGAPSSYNTIRGNTIASSSSGLRIGGWSFSESWNNTIHYNNFIENTVQVEGDKLAGNMWDNGGLYECPVCGVKRPKGNYWSDYSGRDDNSPTQAHNCPGDGIGDTDTPHLEVDRYPLIALWMPVEGDINLDGIVNIIDIAMAAKNYGKTEP